MTRRDATQTLLGAYLALYTLAIALALVLTHNVVSAALHAGLLILGAVALQAILATFHDPHL
jgi:hypothetical protein